LDQSNVDSSHPVVIFPGSGNPAKNWPAEKFAALASTLSKRASVAVILGPAESSLKSIFRDRGVAALKDLDLPTVAAIARLAAAFVGNDSGVSHLAAAVGTAGLAIFGPTDPARWRPLGGRIDILRRNPIDSIEVEEVAAALSKFVT
jgi:ADP-heptose:LPS heptosyltransferase